MESRHGLPKPESERYDALLFPECLDADLFQQAERGLRQDKVVEPTQVSIDRVQIWEAPDLVRAHGSGSVSKF